MKKLVLLSLLIFIPRCGVHVGNGKMVYESKHGYQVSYSMNLKFTESDDGKVVRISEDVQEGDLNQQSFVEFKANPNVAVRSEEELKRFAREFRPDRELKEINIGGQLGFLSELKSENSLLKYIITRNFKNDLFQVNFVAYSKRNGINEMNEVLKGFKFIK